MCEYPCFVPKEEEKFRHLSLIILDCWQREYDKRPYRCFKFERVMFENRFRRKFDFIQDFAVITLFLEKRHLITVKLVGLNLTTYIIKTLYNFVESLKKFKCIELKLMNLPTKFYELMTTKVDYMKLVELLLEGTPLNDDDIYYLHSFLVRSPTLQSLNVSSCSLTQYNYANIADGVYKSAKINTFKASYIIGLHLHLDAEKIAFTTASLLWQNKLHTLELQNCGFQAQDMEILSEYLINQSSNLITLNLSSNKIGPNGVLVLLKAISHSGNLKHLNVNACGLGSHGGEIVAHYLSSCWNLESVMLQYNNIGAEIISLLLLCMKKCCRILKLYLFGNSYNPRTGKILRRLLESRVVPQDNIDLTVTYDDTIPGYRVIPWRP